MVEMNRGRLSRVINACRGTACRAPTVDRFLRTIIFFVLTAAPIPALADYASIYGLSPRATAMGGAFTAVADDVSAVFYNPAGLALDRPDALVAGYIFAAPRIRLREDLTGEEYTAFDEELSAGQIGLAIAMDPIFTSLKHRFVIGMLISFTGDTKVASWVDSKPWSERQLPVSGRAQDVMVMAYGAGLEIFPWLRIGAGFRFNVTYNANRMEFTFRVPELEFVVNRIDIKAETEMAPTAGLLVRPTEKLSIGLTWRREHSAANIVAHGSNRIEVFDDLVFELPLKIDFYDFYSPTEVAAGMVYTLAGGLELSADLTFARWSRFDNPFGERPQGVMRDIWVPRLGASWAAGPDWTVMGGYAYHPSPVRSGQSETAFIDNDQHSFSAGARYAVSPNRILRKPLLIDGAIQYKYLPSRHFDTVSGSFRTWGHVFCGTLSVTLQF